MRRDSVTRVDLVSGLQARQFIVGTMQNESDALGRLHGVGEIATFPKGATIVHSGERARHVAVLLEGVVEEIVGNAVTVVDTPGTLLGPERAFGDDPAVGTLRAVTRCALLLVPPDQFRSALDGAVGAWVLAHLDERLRRARAALLDAVPDLAEPAAAYCPER
jgi:CRP-like cAMP-binding protein